MKLEHSEIGQLLRRRRKSLGLRLEDLADESISAATISKIERGIPSVSQEMFDCYLSKLGISDLQELVDVQVDQETKEEEIKTKLFMIKSLLDHAGPSIALAKLRSLDISNHPKYLPEVKYLKGKAYFIKQNYEKAKKYFYEAISIVENHNQSIGAMAYCYLGMIEYNQSNLYQAIDYTDLGLNIIEELNDETYKEEKYMLLLNKIIYLEKLDRNSEAFGLLQELWEHKHKIETIQIKLNMYELFALILKKAKLYHQAIRYAKEGIEMARRNKEHSRAFDLWTSLGKIYFEMGELDEAEFCYLTALELRDKVTSKDLLIDTYADLGELYSYQKEWQLAEENLNEALKIGNRYNGFKVAKVLEMKGTLKYHTGQHDEAIHCLEKALQLLQQYGSIRQQQRILLRLSKYCKDKSQEKYYYYLDRLFDTEEELN
ncbi:tetratricopeptide repeat protein [Thermoflavimicrobium dichotomicum]|uniref:tetratricopeptide repeat protein n=1 Tax=Thermoflavimicrobium dichotomicum TaxID=46223 RepID=UPI001587EE79|nr:tetratricopeptide repeat protein [Thermoflavimicrobium dichotomicum]